MSVVQLGGRAKIGVWGVCVVRVGGMRVVLEPVVGGSGDVSRSWCWGVCALGAAQ